MPESFDPFSVFEQTMNERLRDIRTIDARRPILERNGAKLASAVTAGINLVWWRTGGSAMAGLAHSALCAKSTNNARVQNGETLSCHMQCDWAEISTSAAISLEQEIVSR